MMGTQFVKIPRKFLTLDKGTKFLDVLVYAIIDFYKDGTTYKSRIGMRTIAFKYNIALSKVEDAIKRLKENKFIESVKLPAIKEYDFNEYSFNYKKEFLMLDPELLTLPLKPKERGILIYLQLIALPNMNDIVETKIEDIANRLKITRQTMSKYLKFFIANNYLSLSKTGLYKCKYLKYDLSRITQSIPNRGQDFKQRTESTYTVTL